MERRDSSSIEHMAAGSFAGVAAVALLHPLDVVKTRLQGIERLSPMRHLTPSRCLSSPGRPPVLTANVRKGRSGCNSEDMAGGGMEGLLQRPSSLPSWGRSRMGVLLFPLRDVQGDVFSAEARQGGRQQGQAAAPMAHAELCSSRPDGLLGHQPNLASQNSVHPPATICSRHKPSDGHHSVSFIEQGPSHTALCGNVGRSGTDWAGGGRERVLQGEGEGEGVSHI